MHFYPAFNSEDTDRVSTALPAYRDGIGDERVVCMAAEAMAFALISDGSCRVVWVKQGSFVSLLDLLRCACEIIEHFLGRERGAPIEPYVLPSDYTWCMREANEVYQLLAGSVSLCYTVYSFRTSMRIAALAGSTERDMQTENRNS